ncbi:hypothetical protein LCGC14_0565060 [marine sediment metagenome]|uniref:Uncharacterized protein n=1 Tax=marine sediment metagenome TaxID=412755 RepID=A0A0F9UU64_9ZZZZ
MKIKWEEVGLPRSSKSDTFVNHTIALGGGWKQSEFGDWVKPDGTWGSPNFTRSLDQLNTARIKMGFPIDKMSLVKEAYERALR